MKPDVTSVCIVISGNVVQTLVERAGGTGTGTMIKVADAVHYEDVVDALETVVNLAGLPYRDPARELRRRHDAEQREARVKAEVDRVLGPDLRAAEDRLDWEENRGH